MAVIYEEDQNRFFQQLQLVDQDKFSDLRLTKVEKLNDESDHWLLIFEKEVAWDPQILMEFFHALTHINFHYQIRFSYKLPPTIEDAMRLFECWHSDQFILPANQKIQPSFDGIIELIFPANDDVNHVDSVTQEFSNFLTFINYPFAVIGKREIENHVSDVEEVKMVVSDEEDELLLADQLDINTNEDIGETIGLDYSEVPLPDEELAPVDLDSVQQDIVRDGSEYVRKIAEKNRDKMEKERQNQQLFKRGQYQTRLIRELDTNSANVDFSGQIFSIETRKTKNSQLFIYGVKDLSGGAIYVKMFESKTFDKKKQKLFAVGSNLRVRGAVGVDYDNSLMVMGHYLDILPPDELRTDSAKEKRVELHLHTNMSAMDGISKIEKYCELAAHMGHKAIALTDHGVVQAFPKAQEAAKKYNLKMLYGCEFYMIDTHLEGATNPEPIPLSNATYVVFDFETTGLSAKYDKIIEFGAVKVVKGMVRERIDILINPGANILITPKITSITNITPAMLVGQPSLKEALPRINEFIGDAILVSHNAEFDIAFLDAARIQFGLGKVTNPIVNTLPLSRYLFPTARSHRLGDLARNLEVEYDQIRAHRADYDAEVLNAIWQAMIAKFTAKNPHITHADLSSLEADQALYKHLYPKHVIVLAKDAIGLKDLYKLISLSHTDYYADVPKIPRHVLASYREHLFIGSACFNGEVFDTAMYRGSEKLEEVMKFYDYIEIQPPENYSFLIHMDRIKDEAMLLKLMRDVLDAAKRVGKISVATGDVHYANPEDKVFRDVYIMAKGIGGVNHPLNPYDRINAQRSLFENPDQHYRSTEEMLAAFLANDFCTSEEAQEIVVTNSNMIADACNQLFPIRSELSTPKIDNVDVILKDICYEKARRWYGDPLPDIVSERLTRELNGIIAHGYSVIYYIANKIIKKANEDGFMVGSRGSVGSSFVATMADITEVNPLAPHYRCPHCSHSEFDPPEAKNVYSGYDLPDKKCPHCGTKMVGDGQNIPFATFLGFNADKTPDIDLNFPGDYQAQAHEYTKVLLGEKNVYRAGTIETVADKTAFGYARGFFERIGRDLLLVPKAEVAALAAGCVDVKKTTGQHPGGIVVIPKEFDVYDFTPIQYPANDLNAAWKTTHFDFTSIHDNILKLDLLGHVDPMALKMMGDLTGIDPIDIPMNDSQVLSLFSSPKALKLKKNYLGATNGALALPEFGTPFVRSLLDDTKPKTFADLLVISGLSHGTAVWYGNNDEIIRSGKATLQSVIGCRDDIMMYLISKGLDPLESFKIMEEVRKADKTLSAKHIQMMLDHGVPEYYVESCKKIQYLFPKAHATAYVMMAVRVGWFKIYYPLEFYATYFTVRSKQYDIEVMSKGIKAIKTRLDEYAVRRQKGGENRLTPKEEEIEKTLQIAMEMLDRGYNIQNIDLYRSEATRYGVDHKTNSIIPPFTCIDGLGESAAVTVVNERKNGEFISIDDLIERTKLNSQNIDNLMRLGVLKNLPEKNQMNIFDFL
ncbi:MAG: PolC-type DNA polymerase III [Bacilli bacterium]|jgi:DNA polymerase-3 subunit alpha (Gram-positive type)